MKQRVNTIKGKRLVSGGDTNTLTKDEILVTETPEGVVLKERDYKGTIKDLSSGGSNTSNNEVLYYKIIHSDDVVTFPPELTGGETVQQDVKTLIMNILWTQFRFLSVISFKEIGNKQSVSNRLYISNSNDAGENTLNRLETIATNGTLSGLAIYRGETCTFNDKDNSSIIIKEGDITEKYWDMMYKITPSDYLEVFLTPTLISFYDEIMKSYIIQITKEEYEALI